jgi:hypothetical protein
MMEVEEGYVGLSLAYLHIEVEVNGVILITEGLSERTLIFHQWRWRRGLRGARGAVTSLYPLPYLQACT